MLHTLLFKLEAFTVDDNNDDDDNDRFAERPFVASATTEGGKALTSGRFLLKYSNETLGRFGKLGKAVQTLNQTRFEMTLPFARIFQMNPGGESGKKTPSKFEGSMLSNSKRLSKL
jgi:hypothetical protein